MERTEITSSMIRSVGHDPTTNILEVEFTDGGVFQYPATAEEHMSLLRSDSIGKHFHSKIRSRKGTKVS